MIEKIMFVKYNNLWDINNELGKGWTVKHIAPVRTNSSGCDIYGAYVVLQKEKEEME